MRYRRYFEGGLEGWAMGNRNSRLLTQLLFLTLLLLVAGCGSRSRKTQATGDAFIEGVLGNVFADMAKQMRSTTYYANRKPRNSYKVVSRMEGTFLRMKARGGTTSPILAALPANAALKRIEQHAVLYGDAVFFENMQDTEIWKLADDAAVLEVRALVIEWQDEKSDQGTEE